jgi:hypothetical protein
MSTEPLGMDRLKEALEANDWEGSDELGDAIDLAGLEDDSDDAASIGFGLGAADKAEMEKEMRGMKMDIYAGSISGGGDGSGGAEEPSDKDVEDLQAMMLKMQAVRGTFLPGLMVESLVVDWCRSGGRYAGRGEEKVRRQGSQ